MRNPPQPFYIPLPRRRFLKSIALASTVKNFTTFPSVFPAPIPARPNMNTPMITSRIILSIVALICASFFPCSIGAQSMTTDPVGFTTTSLPANSDTLINPPFTRPSEYVGAITSASGSTITVAGSPWTANQFIYMQGVQPRPPTQRKATSTLS
jgi:hypothetical protein